MCWVYPIIYTMCWVYPIIHIMCWVYPIIHIMCTLYTHRMWFRVTSLSRGNRMIAPWHWSIYVKLCCVVGFVDSCDAFTHILYGCFTGTGWCAIEVILKNMGKIKFMFRTTEFVSNTKNLHQLSGILIIKIKLFPILHAVEQLHIFKSGELLA